MTEILVIGEALVDVIHHGGRVDEAPGGSPFNVAIGLARLGTAARLATAIGDDPRGGLLRRRLAADGVDVVEIGGPDAATSTAVATIGDDGDARYDFAIDWDVDFAGDPIDGPRHVHTGSLGAIVAPGAERVLDEVRRARATATVSFDPNCRELPGMTAAHLRSVAERFVAVSDIVKASEDDLALLYPDVAPEHAARRWAESGPAIVVVTRGSDGSVAFRAGAEPHRMAIPQRNPVVDTVGAGDSFMAALLAALHDADALGRASASALTEVPLVAPLRWAAAAAAITCSRTGADLPLRAEVEREIRAIP